MAERFDVIVVGAGPGGCACAYLLAKKGFDVLLMEKAKVPGQRNMTGGVLFGGYTGHYGLKDLIPSFEEEAPLERKVEEHTAYVLSQAESKEGKGWSYKFYPIDKGSFPAKMGLVDLNISTGHDYSVLRASFDRWFASKVTEQGGMVSTQTTVSDLVWSGKKIVGIRTLEEEIYADLIVDASGVTSNLVEKAGLRDLLGTRDVYYGIKHVYKLDEATINERFGLKDGREGKALFFLGEFMLGVNGGAFIYTNRTTLSLGIVASLDSLEKVSIEHPDSLGKPLDILETFEAHPMISHYLEGASLVEYSAHNIPKGYKCFLDKPYTDCFLVAGDALGAFVKIGPLIDGMRMAIATGIMAAETYMKAREAGDFSEGTLSYYKELLKIVYRDIRKSKWDSYKTESSFAYNTLPKLLFALGLGKEVAVEKVGDPDDTIKWLRERGFTIVVEKVKDPDPRDAIQRIQYRTGLLNYEEDKVYSHIRVDYDECGKSPTKSWVALCPFNCYTLVLEKGVFASPKDLYLYNLEHLRKEKGRSEKESLGMALKVTEEDIRRGSVRFDHVACVACGTCGVIGPTSAVIFDHERHGHGVKYKYG